MLVLRLWSAVFDPASLGHGAANAHVGRITAERDQAIAVRALNLVPLFHLAHSLTKREAAPRAQYLDLGFHGLAYFPTS